MILATVITCPQRWEYYQRLLRNIKETGLGITLRTFYTKEGAGDPYVNNNLNARAALAYGRKHLPEGGWLLYLEDDVDIKKALPGTLLELVQVGQAEQVDCWYLCTRNNPVTRQFRIGGLKINELAYPVEGAHGLLIPKRNLGAMLAAHWEWVSDLSMFAAIKKPGIKIWQVREPELLEHTGHESTYAPERWPKEERLENAN